MPADEYKKLLHGKRKDIDLNQPQVAAESAGSDAAVKRAIPTPEELEQE